MGEFRSRGCGANQTRGNTTNSSQGAPSITLQSIPAAFRTRPKFGVGASLRWLRIAVLDATSSYTLGPCDPRDCSTDVSGTTA